jgi:hypothetical protein
MTFCKASILDVAVIAAAVAGLVAPATAAEKAESKPMVFELRTYTTEPGKLPDLHKRFSNHTMKLFANHGMTNVIYWTPVDQPDTLIYLLAHKDVDAAKKSFDTFRKDPEWIAARDKSEAAGPIVKKVESQFLAPADYSPVKSSTNEPTKEEAAKSAAPMLYEMRIYTTNEGKLSNLNARFRDHTLKLFEKHGIKNGLYGTPTDEKLTNNTLVYFIAHKDKAAADKSWAEFGKDPEWQKVRDASEKDGKILAPNGVKRVYLTPTEYSPRKQVWRDANLQ